MVGPHSSTVVEPAGTADTPPGPVTLSEADATLRAQKLEALGLLAGGLAHDFNNLLQGIFGFIAAARLANDFDEAKALLGESEEALQMAVRLTTQLLTYARGGAPVRTRIELEPLLRRAVRFALAGSAVACRFDLAEPYLSVEADEGQLEQAVQNVVLNAAQAMSHGGTIGVTARRVSDGGLSGVAIEVQDTGVGIAPERLGRIFDPYVSTRPGAAGLGLATAYSVMRAHGGTIDVRSATGVGSTFTLRLPLASPGPRARAVTPVPVQPAVAAARLLLMDDEPKIRKATQRLLMALGHEADAVPDGAAAVEAYARARAEGRPYALVVLDLTVPGGVGGLEALARLRALDPAVKAVVSSGYSEDAVSASPQAFGFSGVLSKPYTLAQLRAVLDAQLPPVSRP